MKPRTAPELPDDIIVRSTQYEIEQKIAADALKRAGVSRKEDHNSSTFKMASQYAAEYQRRMGYVYEDSDGFEVFGGQRSPEEMLDILETYDASGEQPHTIHAHLDAVRDSILRESISSIRFDQLDGPKQNLTQGERAFLADLERINQIRQSPLTPREFMMVGLCGDEVIIEPAMIDERPMYDGKKPTKIGRTLIKEAQKTVTTALQDEQQSRQTRGTQNSYSRPEHELAYVQRMLANADSQSSNAFERTHAEALARQYGGASLANRINQLEAKIRTSFDYIARTRPGAEDLARRWSHQDKRLRPDADAQIAQLAEDPARYYQLINKLPSVMDLEENQRKRAVAVARENKKIEKIRQKIAEVDEWNIKAAEREEKRHERELASQKVATDHFQQPPQDSKQISASVPGEDPQLYVRTKEKLKKGFKRIFGHQSAQGSMDDPLEGNPLPEAEDPVDDEYINRELLEYILQFEADTKHRLEYDDIHFLIGAIRQRYGLRAGIARRDFYHLLPPEDDMSTHIAAILKSIKPEENVSQQQSVGNWVEALGVDIPTPEDPVDHERILSFVKDRIFVLKHTPGVELNNDEERALVQMICDSFKLHPGITEAEFNKRVPSLDQVKELWKSLRTRHTEDEAAVQIQGRSEPATDYTEKSVRERMKTIIAELEATYQAAGQTLSQTNKRKLDRILRENKGNLPKAIAQLESLRDELLAKVPRPPKPPTQPKVEVDLTQHETDRAKLLQQITQLYDMYREQGFEISSSEMSPNQLVDLYYNNLTPQGITTDEFLTFVQTTFNDTTAEQSATERTFHPDKLEEDNSQPSLRQQIDALPNVWGNNNKPKKR